MSTIICLMGPTATGKSDLAVKLAQTLPVEIISVDSAMVYQGLDIGTAKPDKKILAKIPHYLIDICSPAQIYSAGQFCKDALNAIKKIESRHNIPLLTGGTMLYFQALQKGLSELPPQNSLIRQKINRQAEKIGWPSMYCRLAKIDPITAQRLHPNDIQRVQRALEIYEITGIPLSLQKKQKNYLENYKIINIGLMPIDRQKLNQQITERFYNMLEKGFIAEVENLLSLYPCQDLPWFRSVGYQQIGSYLLNPLPKSALAEMRQKAVNASCQLAKRQMTWLRNPKHWREPVMFFDSGPPDLFKDLFRFLHKQIASVQK